MLAQNTELGLLTRFLKAKPHSLFVALIFGEGSKAQRCGGVRWEGCRAFQESHGRLHRALFTTPGSSGWEAHLGIIQRAQMEGREPLACPVPFIGSPHAEGAALQPSPEALSVHRKWGCWGTTWLLIPCPRTLLPTSYAGKVATEVMETLQIPSALLLRFKACSKAQQLPKGAGQLQPIKERKAGEQGASQGPKAQVGSQAGGHRRWARGSDGGVPGGTRPCLPGNRSQWASFSKAPSRQDVRGSAETPRPSDWSLLGMKFPMSW